MFTSILFIVFGIYSSAFFVNRDIAFIVLGCFVHLLWLFKLFSISSVK